MHINKLCILLEIMLDCGKQLHCVVMSGGGYWLGIDGIIPSTVVISRLSKSTSIPLMDFFFYNIGMIREKNSYSVQIIVLFTFTSSI